MPESSLFYQALTRIPVPLVLLGENRDLIFTNQAAMSLLEDDGRFRFMEGRLVLRVPPGDPMFAWLFGQVMATSQPYGVLAVPAHQGTHRIDILIEALEYRSGTAVLVYFFKPVNEGRALPVLQTLYDLTQAEARLANRLALGHSVAEAAGILGISVATARSHLHHIYRKTGLQGQVDLVRAICIGPAGMLFHTPD